MRVFNSFYTVADGWHTALPTNMDSTQTLVLIFSAPDIDRYQPALNEIHALFPQAIITGCYICQYFPRSGCRRWLGY